MIVRATPRPIISSVVPMKMYVGKAKIVPLSRTPRRFTSITARIETTISGTITGRSGGKAEPSATIPAATLTETVRT